MDRKNTPPVDQYWAALDAALPSFSPEEQRVAVTLYRELAKGQPVDAEQLGLALGRSAAEARALLERDSLKAFAYLDDQGRVSGFGGLTTARMHHQLELEGRTLWTWCAWDTLFMPAILGTRGRVTSPDPETGEAVRLTVTPEEIKSAEPRGAVVSFLLPGADEFVSAANLVKTFCHFIFFFASRASGERWVAKHPGTFLYSLNDAFGLAKHFNARNFGPELARRQTAAA
jgi:alkylmercury lyase